MATKNDKIILELQKKIEVKKNALKTAEKFNPITNCNLQTPTFRYNLNVIKQEELSYVLAHLLTLRTSWNAHFEEAPVEFKIAGFHIDDWITDCEARFDHLTIAEEKKRLADLEKRLEKRLSKDLKDEKEIRDIQNSI